MSNLRSSWCAALATLAIAAAPATAQRPAPLQPGLLRVCADPDNMPFSNQKGEGYENKIAELIAKTWNSQLQYVWWPIRRGYFRMLNGTYCDLVIESPAGLDMAGATKPYYRSGYAFVSLKGSGLENINSLAAWTASQFDPTLSWKDVEWVKSLWPGKLILKGILDVDDAKIAVTTGADAISVSNHGGRQLDGAPSAISALPRVVDAVGSEIEVMFDSGVRTGADIMRALALGARSCIVGRSYIYGLGAGGQAGVANAIEILRKEFDVTMALCGVKSTAEINREMLADTEQQWRPQ